MDEFDAETLMARMNITVERSGADCTRLRMPVEGNTQISGILHGGASATLAETAASLTAYHHAVDLNTRVGGNRLPVCTDLSISHLRPGTGEFVTAEAVALHHGRTRTVHRVEIRNGEGALVALATVGNQLVER